MKVINAKTVNDGSVKTVETSVVPSVVAQRRQLASLSFDSLPDSAFVREAQLVQSPKRPGALVPLPFSAPTLWRKVKASTFPKPLKLSEGVTAWKVADVRAWMAKTAGPEVATDASDDTTVQQAAPAHVEPAKVRMTPTARRKLAKLELA